MTKNVDSSKSPMNEPDSPYYLTGLYLPIAALTVVKLKGDNYVQWQQATLLALRSQNRLGFINGTIKEPAPDSLTITRGIW